MPEQLRQGPATFAFDADPAVGSAATPQLGTPQAQPAQAIPGLTAQAPGVNDADARTYRAIADLASGALAPKIKEAAQAQFLQGVQRAMTGEGLAEIQRDQPWYTDVFAPSSALVGARTYTAQRAVAQWGAKMAEQMPKLAQVGPEELQHAAQGALAGFMTGDPQADAMITASVVEQIGPLYKEHAKHHYLFVQKQATEQQIGAWDALGSVYQRLAGEQASGRGMVSPEDLEAGKGRLLGAMVPFGDQSDESYERNVSAFLEAAATGGNFHVVKLFKDTGMYAKIGADRRAHLDRTINAAAGAAMAKAVPQFAIDIATLVHDTAQDPRSVPGKIAALNAKAAAVTGITEADLIAPSSVDNIVGNIMVAQRNEAERQAEAARRAAEKPDPGIGIAKAAVLLRSPGLLDTAIAGGVVNKEDAEVAGYAAWQAAKTPQERAAVLNARTDAGFRAVKPIFVNTLRSPEYQPGVDQMALVYANLTDDVKPHYFDAADRQLMDRFAAQVQAGVPKATAWVNAKNAPRVIPHIVPEEAKGAIAKAIRSHVEGENTGWLQPDVTDASLRMATAATMAAYTQDLANTSPDTGAKRAYSVARAAGLERVGRHFMLNDRSGSNRPLWAVTGEGMRATAEAMDAVLEEKAKAVGASLDDYEMYRQRDRNGQALIYVTAHRPEDGSPVSWTITSQELKQRVVDHITKRKAEVEAGKPNAPVVGPGGAAFGLVPRP